MFAKVKRAFVPPTTAQVFATSDACNGKATSWWPVWTK